MAKAVAPLAQFNLIAAATAFLGLSPSELLVAEIVFAGSILPHPLQRLFGILLHLALKAAALIGREPCIAHALPYLLELRRLFTLHLAQLLIDGGKAILAELGK